jgi:hypothetical protein
VLAAVVVLVGGGLWIVLADSGTGQHATSPRPSTASPPIAGAPSPKGQPGLIDLSRWKLTIPAENDDGDAAIIQPAAAAPPWMSVGPDGGLVLWAPSVGATTKHSNHPRTELDSLNNFKAGRGVHTLIASVTLLQEPRDGRGIILGQIHGADDISSVPYVMLRYEGNQVFVVVKQVQDGNEHINYPLLNNVALNTQFDFTITDQGNGKLAFSATRGAETGRVEVPVPVQFTGRTVRFQAGDYQQANDPAGSQDGGRVIFHRLDETATAP